MRAFLNYSTADIEGLSLQGFLDSVVMTNHIKSMWEQFSIMKMA